MHEITVPSFFSIRFSCIFFWKMGWKWESSHTDTFGQNYFHFFYPFTTGVSKEAKIIGKIESLWLMLPCYLTKLENLQIHIIVFFKSDKGWNFSFFFAFLRCLIVLVSWEWNWKFSVRFGKHERNSNKKSHCTSEI